MSDPPTPQKYTDGAPYRGLWILGCAADFVEQVALCRLIGSLH